ncbi:MAG TPA: vitamin K epoxide reductase family protein [Puia sp.]|nr:vitamin K epoxide reductase family protein [Puia sp.]
MAQTFNTSLKHVAAFYSRFQKVRVTKTSIQKSIEENPYYPSLLSLSDTFSRYNINNSAFEVDKESFDQLETPFVAFAYMPGVGKDFVLVTEMKNGSVHYLYKSKKEETIAKDEFMKRYQNIVWLAEPDEKSGETNYSEKLKEEKKVKAKKIAWFTAIAMLIIIVFIANVNYQHILSFSIIALLKLLGTATAIMLLIYETDKSNAFVKNLCSAGGHTDCDAVLGSKAAKIVGISWGEIGFFYFAATTLWLLIPSIAFADKIVGIAIANTFAAPYILFSIYYQWKVVKQWCPLCLTVQAILFLELIWSIANFWLNTNSFSSLGLISPLQGSGVVFCLLLPIVAWYGIKPIFVKSKDADLYSSAYKRLQYNQEIFYGLLQQQPKAADGWQQLGISIGNPKASNTIIKVCNPYCGPCAQAHPQLEEIIDHHSDVQLKVIFTSKNNEHDRGAAVAKHLLAVASEGIQEKTRQSLDDWYLDEQKDYEKFAAKYPMNGELKLQAAKIEAMSKWCEESEITYTPTIFVNGHRLPENYNVEELKNIL